MILLGALGFFRICIHTSLKAIYDLRSIESVCQEKGDNHSAESDLKDARCAILHRLLCLTI